MKTIAVVAGLAGLVVLGGCGGPTVEGKWCPVGEQGFVTFDKGKATATTGMSANYTLSGNVITTTEDNGKVTRLILSEDKTSIQVENDSKMMFKRCPA